MTHEELLSQGPPLTWDNTLLSQAAECPRKFYWFMRRIVPEFEATYFVAGRAWQSALVTWYKTQDFEQSCKALQAEYESANMAPDWYNDEKRSPENIARLLARYIETYQHDSWEILDMEIGFQVPFLETPYGSVMIGGSLDGYIDLAPHGLAVLENKTTSERISPSFIRRYDLDFQISTYTWALTQVASDPVFGTLINIASIDIPKRETTERTLFSRYPVQKSREALQDFEISTIETRGGR